jgi:hypothetical protein
VSNDDGDEFDITGVTPPAAGAEVVVAEVEVGLDEAMELLKEARESDDREATLDIESDSVTLVGDAGSPLAAGAETTIANAGAVVRLGVKEIEAVIENLKMRSPPRVQLRPTTAPAP